MAVDNQTKSFEAEVRARGPLPRHVAIIMDGNGRWARMRHLPRIAGHTASRETVRRVVRCSVRVGIPALTLYTFSQENWKRPRLEVGALMKLLEDVLVSEFLELDDNNIRLTWMGSIEFLPSSTREKLLRTAERLSSNSGMVLNLALSYGGRREIVDAARTLAQEIASGSVRADEVDESTFARYLYRPELPEPDLLIRTSGEKRISNFLLWQLAYTELYFTDVLWPDFAEEDLLRALREFQNRERRFGGT
ncbi:MAG: isoprenyl transferase [Candidatus Latescibacterota bacterium]|nr:MAG: isoprenyl transferase [Candidatus Latescibacterota bacterium]